MNSPKKSHPVIRSEARRQLMEAEALRQDGKSSFEAFVRFERVLDEDGKNKNLLSPDQRRWAHAHCGAAASEAFTPNGDNDYLLERAEDHLKKALEGDAGAGNPPYRYPWAQAMLGEVYRNMGNLPILWFHNDEPGKSRGSKIMLYKRDCNEKYTLSDEYFKKAAVSYSPKEAKPTDATMSPGWLKAHQGALLINRRRYYKTNRELRRNLKCALNNLKKAAKLQKYRSPWTNQYLSGAHFTNAITGLKLSTGHYKPLWHLLVSLEFSVVGWYTAPNFMKNPIQPGAFEMDPTFTILYDLFDLMATPPPSKKPDLDDLITATRGLAGALAVTPKIDLYLPGASSLRFDYANVYLTYLQRNALKKTSSEARVQRMERQILQDARSIARRAKEIRTMAPGLIGVKKLSMLSKNGFLLSVLSVLTTLLKTGTILKTIRSEAPLTTGKASDGTPLDKIDKRITEISNELTRYNKLLPVLKNKSRKSITLMMKLQQKNHKRRLLAPLWTGGEPQEEALRKLLKLKINARDEASEAASRACVASSPAESDK